MMIQRGAVPPSAAVEVEPIRDALAAHEAAVQEARASDRRLVLLERSGRQKAETADAQELATALETGAVKKPTARHAAMYEKELADAKRTAAATKLVEATRWTAVTVAFQEHGAQLKDQTERETEKRRRDYLKALDRFQQALDSLAEMTSWTLFFADTGMGHGMFRASNGSSFTIARPAPHSLDDRVVVVADVIERLREAGAPPKPRITNPHQRLVEQGEGDRPLQPRHRPLHEQGVTGGIGAPGVEITAP